MAVIWQWQPPWWVRRWKTALVHLSLLWAPCIGCAPRQGHPVVLRRQRSSKVASNTCRLACLCLGLPKVARGMWRNNNSLKVRPAWTLKSYVHCLYYPKNTGERTFKEASCPQASLDIKAGVWKARPLQKQGSPAGICFRREPRLLISGLFLIYSNLGAYVPPKFRGWNLNSQGDGMRSWNFWGSDQVMRKRPHEQD